MSEHKRLDCRLIEIGLAPSREKAKNLIVSGSVLVNHLPAHKPSQEVDEEDTISLTDSDAAENKYVSRGGYKLEGALRAFSFDPKGLICLDAGASTGGFTDCLLQNGAEHIYAVDVGHGQFSEKLKNNSRITEKEGVNVRYLNRETLPVLCDLTVADLSYISLTKVLPALAGCTKEGGSLICLIKPQFEAGPGAVDKKGVIRDAKTHILVLKQMISFCESIGLSVQNLTYSPILGPEGNIEFLIHLINKKPEQISTVNPETIVRGAHDALCRHGEKERK